MCRGGAGSAGGEKRENTNDGAVMRRFDVKSLVIGVLLTLCAMLAIGAANGDQSQRYDIAVAHDITNGQPSQPWVYVLDRQTNRVYLHRGANAHGEHLMTIEEPGR
jgi:hypothetical protein